MTNNPHNLPIFFVMMVIVGWLAACAPTATLPAAATPTPTVAATHSPSASKTPFPGSSARGTKVVYPALKKLGTLGKGIVPSIIHSADGSLVIISDNKIARVLNAKDQQEIASVSLTLDKYQYNGIDSISPNKQLLLMTTFSGFAVLDIKTQSQIARGASSNGFAVAPIFSADSRYIVYRDTDHTSGGPYHSICLLYTVPHPTSTPSADDEFQTGPCYPTFDLKNRHYDRVTNPALSPDGRLVAAGYVDTRHNILYIWDAIQQTIRFEIKEQPSEITSVSFSPDGGTLASSSDDGMVRLWNPITGTLKRTIPGFIDSIDKVQFSADGTGLIVSVTGQPDVLYNLASGKQSPIAPPTMDPLAVNMLKDEYLLNGAGSKILFSPDGKNIAIGHGSIQIWDAQTRQLRQTFVDDQPLKLSGMAYSPDGKHLAVVNLDGSIFSWNIETGQRELTLTADILAAGQVFYASGGEGLGPGIGFGVTGEQGIAFSADGKTLALGNGLDVELWDIATASKTLTLEHLQPAAYPTNVSFSADGRLVYATLNRNRDAAVWDALTGKLLRRLNLPKVDPNAFSATALHGSLFARNNYVDEDYWIELWNLDQNKMRKLSAPAREMEPLRFSADGRFFAAIAKNSQLYIWRTDTGQLVFISDKSFDVFEVGDMALGVDGKTLATADYGQVSLWDVGPYTQAAFATNFTPPALPPTQTPYPTSVKNYPSQTPEPTQAITPIPLPTLAPDAIAGENAGRLHLLAQFGNGNLMQLVWGKDDIFVTSSQGVYVYDPATLKETRHFEPPGLSSTHSRLLPDGRLLVTGTIPDGKIQLWDAQNNKMLVELPGTGEPAISPDGKWLVFEKEDQGLQSWNLETGKAGVLLHSSWYTLYWPVFNPNSTLVAAVQSNRSIRVWDLATGAIVDGIGGPTAGITDMSFSPDGNYIVGAAGGTAWVWSLKPSLPPFKIDFYQGEVQNNLILYKEKVSAIALSMRSSQIAIGTTEHDIWIYDRTSGRALGKLTGHKSTPVKLSFSPDGTRLVSLDADGKMMLWDLATYQPLNNSRRLSTSINGFTLRVDGGITVWGENTLWTLNPNDATPRQITSIPGGKILSASPAGDLVAAYSPLRVSLYDATSGKLQQTLPEEAEDVMVEHMYEGQILRQFYGATFSPDGKRLATFGTGGIWFYSLPSGAQTGHAAGNHTRSAAFSPDGGWLVASRFDIGDSCPSLFNAQNGQDIFNYFCSLDSFVQNRFSPDKRWIGAVSNYWNKASALLIANAANTQLAKSLSFETAKLISLAFSPDASLVAVGQADGKIDFVNVETMKIVATLDAHLGPVTFLEFSPDGGKLISLGQDSVLKIWSVLP